MSRVKSTIEFYENVPIQPEFKKSPLFKTKKEQLAFFNKYKNEDLTFEGSYQRTEMQIRTNLKIEQLQNVNYVHVTNPSYEGASGTYEWWGKVIDSHYIDDELVTVDWVVDPIQTFMFKWQLNYATIERGMINAVKKDGDGHHILDENKAQLLANSEPVGVDGLAYAIGWDDLGDNVSYFVLVTKDSEDTSYVGIPSQVSYYVLPFRKDSGWLINYEIQNVAIGKNFKTLKTGRNFISFAEVVDKIVKNQELTGSGENIVAAYYTNETGFAFEKVDSTHIKAVLDKSENETGYFFPSNLELFDFATGKVVDDTDEPNPDDDDDNTTIPADKLEFIKLPVKSEFGLTDKQIIAGCKNSGRVSTWLKNNDSNIQKVIDIVRANGMSAALFFAYERNEGYSSGLGWLNHTQTTGDPYEDADYVSSWAVEAANTSGNPELAWYDVMNPIYTTPADKQEAGQKIANALPVGCIGRMYLQGTAAATWELFDPDALKASVNGVQDYGAPLGGMMATLKAWKKKG